MASNQGAVATEAPLPSHPTPSATATIIPSDESTRALKRQREATPTSPDSLTSQHPNPLGSPTKSARLALANGSSPPPLTGAAALEDERRRREVEQALSPPASTENPSHRVLASLLSGATEAMSRPNEVPLVAPEAAMESAAKAAAAASASLPPEPTERVEEDQHNRESTPQSSTGIAGAGVTASPTSMDVDPKDPHSLSHQVAGQDERPQSTSLSYPGSLQASNSMADTTPRGMSFPMPTHGQASPPSSSSKKHKCPYCNTEFTRHHNLKSHLLTHSQEKPFVCTECPLRFRRLHDLKRHGKLHTGEKPHVCPKCDRKFARGDALARHSKGAGGCAGRRSSMGSFADGDDLDHTLGEGEDSTMSGLGYENGDEDELRRQSLPSVNAQHASGSETDAYAGHARTYPPALTRPAASGLYPPNVTQTSQPSSNASSSIPNSLGSNHTPNTSISSVPVGSGGTGMYSQANMTESPKALSPGVPNHDASNSARQRSPGPQQQASTQHQQQLGRRLSDIQPAHSGQNQTKLPGLSHPSYPSSTSPNFNSHARTPSGQQPGSESRSIFGQTDPSVWTYISSLEDKVKALTERVSTLDQEVVSLKKQAENRDAAAPVTQ